MNEEYLNRGMDLKRMLLYFQKKIWVIIMLIVLGATFGGVAYQIIKGMRMPVEYETVSKLYISFGADENGEVYQYYNGYTWNDLLDADPILDLIMASLPGYDREQVREATTAEILSDIRLLTVYVRGDNEKFVREIRDAVEGGLMEYAKESRELDLIKAIRSEAPQRVYWDDRTSAACITGAVIVGILAFMLFGFAYAFNEGVYVQSDIEKRYPYKALGILTLNQKGLEPYAGELKANLRYTLGEQKTFAIVDMANHSDMRKLEIEGLLNRGEMEVPLGTSEEEFGWHIMEEESPREADEWEVVPFNENVLSEEACARIRELGGVIVLLPFGTDVGRKTERKLCFLKNQDCPILGMIIAQADEEFLNRYFA
ncbi:MAG: hypothetical protein NC429_06665 [Lachnospiraceae bacterium]|nr:hypothetical protein [Lachnospiraceae bacterium]